MSAGTLHELLATPAVELAEQSTESLFRIKSDAADLLAAVKTMVEHIDRAVELKYAHHAHCLSLTEIQRAMVATQLATLAHGSKQHAPIGAPSQEHAAELLKVYLPANPPTEAALCDWIVTSVPGARIQYHQGLLLVDRSEANSPFPPKERQRIHAVAKRAWHACESGLVHLVSQRVEPFVFRYLAVRTRMTPDASQARKQLRTSAH